MAATDSRDGIHGQRIRKDKGYESIRREALQDPRLSFKATGILAHLLSRPDMWHTNADRLGMERPGKEGRDAVRTGLAELEAAGYLLRKRIHLGGGKWRWLWAYTDTPGDLQGLDVTTLPPTEGGFPTDGSPNDGNGNDGSPTDGRAVDIRDLGSRGFRTRDLEETEKEESDVADAPPDTPPAPPQPDNGEPLPPPVKAGVKKQPPAEPERADVTQLCTQLRDAMIANGCRSPEITNVWRAAARRLLDRDARPLDEVVQVLAWCQQDQFWQTNILSMPKFRAQYDRLRMQWRQRNGRHLQSVAEYSPYRNPVDQDLYDMPIFPGAQLPNDGVREVELW